MIFVTLKVKATLIGHPCYGTDVSIAKARGLKSYFRYTVQNTQWTFCMILFFFSYSIYIFRKCMFCVQLYGKLTRCVAIASIFKHFKGFYSKTHLNFFWFFAGKITLLSRRIIKLIPLGPQPQSAYFLHVIIPGCGSADAQFQKKILIFMKLAATFCCPLSITRSIFRVAASIKEKFKVKSVQNKMNEPWTLY